MAVQAVPGDLVSGRDIPCKSGKNREIGGNLATLHKNCRAMLQKFQSPKGRIPWDTIREFLRASREINREPIFEVQGKLVSATGSIKFGLTKVNESRTFCW